MSKDSSCEDEPFLSGVSRGYGYFTLQLSMAVCAAAARVLKLE